MSPRKNWRKPRARRRDVSPAAWPEVARAGAWAVQVQPWCGYDEHNRGWWRAQLTHDGVRYWLGYGCDRFARSWELSRLRRRCPEVEAPALAALQAWARGSSLGVPITGPLRRAGELVTLSPIS